MQPERLSFDIPATPPVPGHRIVCWRWGNASHPAIVCLHGLTRNGRDFDFLAQSLAEKFHVICPDMPGRGDSEWLSDPTAYNYATYVGDMIFLLNALGIAHTHWIGTSMGGIVAMMLAGAQPGRLRSLVFNDIGITIPAAGLRRIMNYAGVKTHFSGREEAEKSLREIWKPFNLTELQFPSFFSHSVENAPGGGVRMRYDPKIAATFPKPEDIKDIDLSALWPALSTIPVLLIRGAESDILTRETAAAMKSSHPNLTFYEVAKTGHAPVLMDAAQIAFVKNWLELNSAGLQ